MLFPISLDPLFLISSCQEQEEWQATPRTEIIEMDAYIAFPSLAFPFGERHYLRPSFDMLPFGLMASIAPCFLGDL